MTTDKRPDEDDQVEEEGPKTIETDPAAILVAGMLEDHDVEIDPEDPDLQELVDDVRKIQAGDDEELGASEEGTDVPGHRSS